MKTNYPRKLFLIGFYKTYFIYFVSLSNYMVVNKNQNERNVVSLDKIIEFLNNSNFGKAIKRESELQKYFGSVRRSLYGDKPDEEILKVRGLFNEVFEIQFESEREIPLYPKSITPIKDLIYAWGCYQLCYNWGTYQFCEFKNHHTLENAFEHIGINYVDKYWIRRKLLIAPNVCKLYVKKDPPYIFIFGENEELSSLSDDRLGTWYKREGSVDYTKNKNKYVIKISKFKDINQNL